MTQKQTLTKEEAQHLVDVYQSIKGAARVTKFSFHQIRNALQREEPKGPALMTLDDYREALSKALEATPLPPVPEAINATVVSDMGFSTPQEGVAILSDVHYGSFIDQRVTAGLAYYDEDIADQRIVRWRDGILRFTQQDQTLLKLDVLHLFALGDDIEGHGEMFITQKLSMSDSVGFVTGKYIARMAEVIPAFLSRYKKVIVYKVRGNHGRIAQSAKGDYPPDNLELMAWRNIADRCAQMTGGKWRTDPNGVEALLGGQIEFYIYPSIMAFIDIMGYTFVIRHGDGVKGIASTYTGLVDNKLRMNAIVGEVINYYLIAHHHEAQSIENEIGGESMVNGCFVGPSLLSIKMQRPAASIPSQEFFLLHPKHGITNRHRIRLATKEEMRALINWTGRSV